MELKKNEQGSIVISPDVVEKIALTAACDVSGVAGAVPRTLNFRNIIKTQRVSKSVICTVRDNSYMIDAYIRVKEGVKLTEVATKVQQNIKEAVQNMTGTVVTKINIHICEIELNKSEENK